MRGVQPFGDSVLVIDKEPEGLAGGASRCNGGLLRPKDAGALALNSFYQMSDEYCERYAAEHVKTVEFILDHGATYIDPDAEWKFVVGNGPALYEAIKSALAESNTEVLYETKAVKLITGQQGNEVLGVVAEQGDKQLFIRASKGVVLCTGAYTGNAEMISELHYPMVTIYNENAPYLTGDGHRMAFAIGAQPWRMAMSLEFYAYCSVAASDEIGTGITCQLGTPGRSGIYVNGDGKRFTNEDNKITHLKGCPDILGILR